MTAGERRVAWPRIVVVLLALIAAGILVAGGVRNDPALLAGSGMWALAAILVWAVQTLRDQS